MTVLGTLLLGVIFFWVVIYNLIVWPDCLLHTLISKLRETK